MFVFRGITPHKVCIEDKSFILIHFAILFMQFSFLLDEYKFFYISVSVSPFQMYSINCMPDLQVKASERLQLIIVQMYGQ